MTLQTNEDAVRTGPLRRFAELLPRWLGNGHIKGALNRRAATARTRMLMSALPGFSWFCQAPEALGRLSREEARNQPGRHILIQSDALEKR